MIKYYFPRLFFINTAFIVMITLFSFNTAMSDEAKLVPQEKITESIPLKIESGKSFVLSTKRETIRVAVGDPEIAKVKAITRKQILVNALKPGGTNIIVWYPDETTRTFDVIVYIPGSLINQIKKELKRLIPEAAKVKVSAGREGVILTGEVDSQETLQAVLTLVSGYSSAIVNLISLRGSQQVQLEVKIAEVSRSNMKKLGLGFLTNNDWGIGVFSAGNAKGRHEGFGTRAQGTTGGIESNNSGLVSDLASSVAIGSPYGDAFQVVVHSIKDNALAILSLLKGQGIVHLLAKPTLITMSGQSANFLVGGEFPVPQEGEYGRTSIEYKEYGVMLSFTPTVVGKETITLDVSPEVSTPDYSLAIMSGGVSVPGLKTRRGSTTLQLKDGQTFVMAGLIKEDLYSVNNKIPFLGDLPFLGTLFTSKEYRKNETELVIIVTVHLVKPLNQEEVTALPGLDTYLPGDMDFFIKNRTHGDKIKISPDLMPAFSGSMGFTR